MRQKIDWEKFKAELMLQFGTAPHKDGFRELCKLKQTNTVRYCQSRFERLLGKAGALTDKKEMTYFISGLRELLWADVRAQNPTTLSTAISLARIYEGKNQEGKRRFSDFKPSPLIKRGPTLGAKVFEGGEKGVKPNLPVRKFTPAELHKQRKQGLCFHCDERYTFNHECKKLF